MLAWKILIGQNNIQCEEKTMEKVFQVPHGDIKDLDVNSLSESSLSEDEDEKERRIWLNSRQLKNYSKSHITPQDEEL